MAGATVKSLQQRLEESKRSGKEKDASAARLKAHVRQLEESVQSAHREADEREARREREYKMLQDVSLRENITSEVHLFTGTSTFTIYFVIGELCRSLFQFGCSEQINLINICSDIDLFITYFTVYLL